MNASVVAIDDSGSLMQPRRRQLYLESLTSEPRPVPGDWKKTLEATLDSLPHDATLDELIESVADVTPDRCRSLIEAVEDEVDVMEDAMSDVVDAQLKQFAAQQKAQLRSLEAATRAAQEAVCQAQERLYRRVPEFDWDRYYGDPHYLFSVPIHHDGRAAAEGSSQNQQDINTAIEQCKTMRRLLLSVINLVNDRTSKMERDFQCGVVMGVNEEMARVQKENAAVRCLYNYLKSISDDAATNRVHR